MFGKADPYVLVQLGDQRVKSKTVIIPPITNIHKSSPIIQAWIPVSQKLVSTPHQVGNSQNPDWDFTANINFNGDSRQQLVIEVSKEDWLDGIS